ncbi:uncharacterized protein LOC103967436 [Pyrus x bretschneideri]|uniref:uncharacterized protein LOC103967436 n=1 Tax=Pyrus x bretschneideri TaxID=225117 RepID=UPI00202FF5AA|nr:uncharacterized protein LOC103967436 [Pyrus x bretschneideri]
MASSSSSFVVVAPSVTNFLTIKLDRNNYPLWHAQFLPLLRSHNLFSFVIGDNQCLSAFLLDDNNKFSDKVNPLYSEWIQTDQMILSWITSSFTPKVLATIVNKIDSASAWSSLQERYASTSQNRIIQIQTELMNTSHGDLSIADYLDKVNVLADNLALSEASVSELDLVAIIMSKVGPQYETTVASAQARDTPITYNALEVLLLSTKQRHHAFSLPSDVNNSAFAAVRDGRGGSFRGGCGGGYARGNGSSRTYTDDSSSPITSSCGPLSSSNGIFSPASASSGFSHAPAFSSPVRIQVPSSRLHAYAATPLSRALPTASTTSIVQQWLFDSGTNSHITNDAGQLHNPCEYYGTDQIHGVHGGLGFMDGEDPFTRPE